MTSHGAGTNATHGRGTSDLHTSGADQGLMAKGRTAGIESATEPAVGQNTGAHKGNSVGI